MKIAAGAPVESVINARSPSSAGLTGDNGRNVSNTPGTALVTALTVVSTANAMAISRPALPNQAANAWLTSTNAAPASTRNPATAAALGSCQPSTAVPSAVSTIACAAATITPGSKARPINVALDAVESASRPSSGLITAKVANAPSHRASAISRLTHDTVGVTTPSMPLVFTGSATTVARFSRSALLKVGILPAPFSRPSDSLREPSASCVEPSAAFARPLARSLVPLAAEAVPSASLAMPSARAGMPAASCWVPESSCLPPEISSLSCLVVLSTSGKPFCTWSLNWLMPAAVLVAPLIRLSPLSGSLVSRPSAAPDSAAAAPLSEPTQAAPSVASFSGVVSI